MSSKLAKPVRQLWEVIKAENKGLGVYLQDVLSVLQEIVSPSLELVRCIELFAYEVKSAYGKYDPEKHHHFHDFVATVSEAFLEYELSNDVGISNLEHELKQAIEQLKADRKDKVKQNHVQREQKKRDRLAKDVLGFLEAPENATVFDVETRRRIRLKPESLAALRESLGGAIQSRKRKATDDATADSSHLDENISIPADLAEESFSEMIPTTDVPDIFDSQFVDDKDLKRENFKIYDFGYVYGLKKAPDGTFRLIFAAAFFNLDHFSRRELAHIKYMYRWFLRAQEHAYVVLNNHSQNGDKLRGREGWLKMVGWRSNRSGPKKTGENIGPYVPKNNVEAYERIYRQSEKISIGAPIFGDYRSDISEHMPGMGSNMAFSTADDEGHGYANTSHVDSDIDGTVNHRGCVWTSGTWLNGTVQGKLINSRTGIQNGIRGGKFILPAYCFGIDLGAAPVVVAIWRGGLDYHCTTSSTAVPGSQMVRFGASVQTNRVVASKATRGTGIWGLEERLAVYNE